MSESIKAGHIVEIKTSSTLSDATAGGIEADAITFELCQKYVDNYILVSESEIKKAIVTILEKHRMLVEGAAGVALAGLIKKSTEYLKKNIVIVLSGANISFPTLQQIICY
jgi:threonine dehydratase